jgi:hypothetical protein
VFWKQIMLEGKFFASGGEIREWKTGLSLLSLFPYKLYFIFAQSSFFRL